ncbi:MAG: GNAT family N-acetyltransferase [Bacteroidetes bacterium]|nr:GNAT family N-acetyltransferase [Bacteroidota bacterium]
MIHFRTAVDEDLMEVKKLLAASALPFEDIDNLISDFEIALVDNKIIGAAGVEKHFPYMLIRSVVIDPTFRNKQIGYQLIHALMDKLYPENYKGFYLLTETAASFFTKLGFMPVQRDNVPVEIQQTTEFSTICPSSAMIMYKLNSNNN